MSLRDPISNEIDPGPLDRFGCEDFIEPKWQVAERRQAEGEADQKGQQERRDAGQRPDFRRPADGRCL
jgi:hypothetical protein